MKKSSMKMIAKWPEIDPKIKNRIVEYFDKCNKMGRPLKAERLKPEFGNVASAVLYIPVWGPDETCRVDNEIISVKVFSYRDAPHRCMLVTVRALSGKVGDRYYTCTTVEHQADAGDTEWLDRLVRYKPRDMTGNVPG
jgi:hypothetical protein